MSKSEEFRRLKEEAERRITAAEEEAHRGRGATVSESVNVKSAAAQKLAVLERTLAAKVRLHPSVRWLILIIVIYSCCSIGIRNPGVARRKAERSGTMRRSSTWCFSCW